MSNFAQIARGEIRAVQTSPGMGVVTAMTQEFSDFGMDYREIQLWQAHEMGDAQFVETLNDIRLADEVLILSGIHYEQDKRVLDNVRMNIEHTLTQLGGRAVFVVFH